jgi:hypothetical protein
MIAATELAARALTYDMVWRIQQSEYLVAKKYAAQLQNRLVWIGHINGVIVIKPPLRHSHDPRCARKISDVPYIRRR